MCLTVHRLWNEHPLPTMTNRNLRLTSRRLRRDPSTSLLFILWLAIFTRMTSGFRFFSFMAFSLFITLRFESWTTHSSRLSSLTTTLHTFGANFFQIRHLSWNIPNSRSHHIHSIYTSKPHQKHAITYINEHALPLPSHSHTYLWLSPIKPSQNITHLINKPPPIPLLLLIFEAPNHTHPLDWHNRDW